MSPSPIQRGIIDRQAPSAPVLRETVFLIDPRSQAFDVADGIPVDLPNTAAGTHDGSDLTFDGFVLSDDGFGNAAGANYIAWTVVATYAGPISFVRVVSRAAFTTDPGATCYYAVMVDLLTTLGAPIFPGPAFANTNRDIATDPTDGLAWTAAKINAHTWGVNINLFGPYFGSAECDVSEYRLEVWGL